METGLGILVLLRQQPQLCNIWNGVNKSSIDVNAVGLSGENQTPGKKTVGKNRSDLNKNDLEFDLLLMGSLNPQCGICRFILQRVHFYFTLFKKIFT